MRTPTRRSSALEPRATGENHDEAITKLKRSQHWRRTIALRSDIGEDEHLRRVPTGNLSGTPDEVIQHIRALHDHTGADHLGVVILGQNSSH
jgi:alkanesulfonate monooxygenase SsuD/methylene tetrahydromethanopterin reductase-like flavin-dependent oxidoreductase (luciferase family)